MNITNSKKSKIQSDYDFESMTKKEDFPSEIKELYLDGNNMLPIFSYFRTLIYKKKKQKTC